MADLSTPRPVPTGIHRNSCTVVAQVLVIPVMLGLHVLDRLESHRYIYRIESAPDRSLYTLSVSLHNNPPNVFTSSNTRR